MFRVGRVYVGFRVCIGLGFARAYLEFGVQDFCRV